jgi:hypothetical protein
MVRLKYYFMSLTLKINPVLNVEKESTANKKLIKILSELYSLNLL